jgi:hypothetical protein
LVVLAVATLGPAAALAEPPPAQIAVSPPYVEVQLGGKPANESLRFTNMGKDPVSVEVTVEHWDLDEQNQVRPLAPTEQSLDQWMIVNPVRFEVQEGATQVVRLAIRPRVQPQSGEHRAMVYFNQRPSVEPAQARVQVLFRFGVAIYANVGEIRRMGVLNGIAREGSTNPPVFGFDIASQGNANVRLGGQYAIWPEKGYPGQAATAPLPGLEKPDFKPPTPIVAAGVLPSTPVLPGTRRTILVDPGVRLPAGRYVLDIDGDLGGGRIDRGLPFAIAAP